MIRQEIKWQQGEKGQEVAQAGKGKGRDILKAKFDEYPGCGPEEGDQEGLQNGR